MNRYVITIEFVCIPSQASFVREKNCEVKTEVWMVLQGFFFSAILARS